MEERYFTAKEILPSVQPQREYQQSGWKRFPKECPSGHPRIARAQGSLQRQWFHLYSNGKEEVRTQFDLWVNNEKNYSRATTLHTKLLSPLTVSTVMRWVGRPAGTVKSYGVSLEVFFSLR